MAPCVITLCSDWPLRLLRFRFHNAQSKCAPVAFNQTISFVHFLKLLNYSHMTIWILRSDACIFLWEGRLPWKISCQGCVLLLHLDQGLPFDWSLRTTHDPLGVFQLSAVLSRNVVGTSCMGTYYVLNAYYVLYLTYNTLHTYRANKARYSYTQLYRAIHG